jgi:tetratricopeptide (TPR) repeat protein
MVCRSAGGQPVLIKLLRQLLLRAWRAAWPARAPQSAPHSPQTLRQAFEALLHADDFGAARTLAAQAAERGEAPYEAQLLLGRAHQKLHEPARALAHFEAALRLRDDDAELYDFRGSMYQELGRLPEAFTDYERALALRPDFPLASFHRAMARLLVGDFERGWEGYELRRLSADHAPAAAGLPRWDGAALAGRSLLVAREQGLGDEIMFASMLPQLIAQAGRVLVECDARLAAIFGRSFPAATVFGTETGGGLPASIAPAPIDAVIEAGSLPGLLRRRAADFPRHQGYLRADPQHVARWRERLAAIGPGLQVGLSWTGGVPRTRRELRSLSLDQLQPLLATPGVRFVSLQYTAGARDDIAAFRARSGIEVAHWPEAIDDYDQTAALVCALDLVVSVCTSLVHLGGALGRPVWVLAPVSPEWRYGFAGESMPWYPSVRLFRQPGYGEWEPVIAAAARELAALRRNPASSATAAASE